MSLLGLLLLVCFTVTMVALAWAALRPSPRSVWVAVAGLSLTPALFVAIALLVWALGR